MKSLVLALFGLVLLAGVTFADLSEENSYENPEEANCVQESCPGNYEVYKCCGKCFQESCMTNHIDCETKCTTGCFCREGFIREYEGGKCMPRRLCYNYLRKGFNSK